MFVVLRFRQSTLANQTVTGHEAGNTMRAESPRPAFTAVVPGRSNRAFTLIEVLVVLAVLALLVAMLVPALMKAKAKANWVLCVGRLGGIGLSYGTFASDHTNGFPWHLSTNAGGAKEFAEVPAMVWRQWLMISNYKSTPRSLWCPADKERKPARDWAAFTNNRHLSYFVGITATEENPQSILAGDRNLLLNGNSISNTVLTFTTNSSRNVAWDGRIHRQAGNVSLGDGSVQQVSSGRLREHFRDAAASGGPQKLVIP